MSLTRHRFVDAGKLMPGTRYANSCPRGIQGDPAGHHVRDGMELC